MKSWASRPAHQKKRSKKRIRDLARKYHPDNYQNNPLADLAQEKMKDINEAYDALTKKRSSTGPGAGGYGYSGQASGGTYQTTPEFAKIRQIINAGDLDAADRDASRASLTAAPSGTSSGATSPSAAAGWTKPTAITRQPARWPPATSNTVQALSMVQYGGNRQYQSGNIPAPATAPTTPALSAR